MEEREFDMTLKRGKSLLGSGHGTINLITNLIVVFDLCDLPTHAPITFRC